MANAPDGGETNVDSALKRTVKSRISAPGHTPRAKRARVPGDPAWCTPRDGFHFVVCVLAWLLLAGLLVYAIDAVVRHAGNL